MTREEICAFLDDQFHLATRTDAPTLAYDLAACMKIIRERTGKLAAEVHKCANIGGKIPR